MTTTTATPTTAAPAFSLAAVYDAIFRFFCSLRLTVLLTTVLTAGCFVGMFVDQTKTFEEHAKVWMNSPYQWKYRMFAALEFHDVFHSWWFAVFILLLALNLVACSIERLPKIWLDIQHADPRLTAVRERGVRNKAQFRVGDGPAFETAFLKAVGRSAKAVTLDEGDTRYLFTEKQKYARLGVYAVHTALLLIMFGSMATTIYGFDGQIGVVEGEQNRWAFGRGPAGLRYRKDLGFWVKCTDFRLKQFVDGAPMDFESDLIIIKNGREMVKKTIQVNDPLEFDGYTLYQSSYQPVPGDEKVSLAIGKPGQPKTTHAVSPGQPINLGDVTYVPLEIIPQYASLGAAVRVQQVIQGQAPTSFVVFRDYPDLDEQVRRGPYALHYKGADKTYMTGIAVGVVPGVSVVFWGFTIMFIGMYMAFFMSHRRYWLRLQKAKDGWEVTVAGASRRHQLAFEEEMDALLKTLEGLPGVRRKA
ncbi:MAG: cytochrome c biogenesis protein ResB [Deltaproteobacteria bacterium]|nr:cytochrome c biogenesis protein ResB [Deltaproteobacteria bacterium]